MSFEVAADAYERFMGRYSEPLSRLLVAELGLRTGQRVLDVGAGPGSSTVAVAEAVGADAVTAVDPSPEFATALGIRLPGIRSALGSAESLDFPDGAFDAALAQLVVPFMTDAVGGLREMARVARPGGRVAASVWDVAGGRAPMSTFWRALAEVAALPNDDDGRAGVRAGELPRLMGEAGLPEVRVGELVVESRYASVDELWQTYGAGVGPAGQRLAGLDPDTCAAVRDRVGELFGAGPVVIRAVAFTAIAVV